jgi:hypothetical protein
MLAADRHNFHHGPGTSAMNLFSLLFALLLALAIIVLLLLCFNLIQRETAPPRAEPARTAALHRMQARTQCATFFMA